MKKFLFLLIPLFSLSAGQTQEIEKKIWLKLFTPHWDNYEYLNGDVKALHYQAYHITDADGKVVIGKPFTFAEAQNVEMRQPWSLYFDRKGNLVSMSVSVDGDIYTGAVHSSKNRIENVYWFNNDSLKFNWEMIYGEDGSVTRLWKNYPGLENSGKQSYMLDKNGNVIKSDSYDKDGKRWYTYECTRDPDGKIKEMKGIDDAGKIKHHYTEYRYNDHGLFESYTMKLLNYSDKDLPASGLTVYEYDDQGNWITRTVRDWMMIQRKIEYYE